MEGYNLQTKKEILERLFKENLITFDEMWILIQDNDVRYIPLPYEKPNEFVPYNPIPYWYGTSGTTSDSMQGVSLTTKF